MPRCPWYRILMTTLVLMLLTVPSVRALEPVSHRTVEAAGFSMFDLFGRAWEGLVSLWMENSAEAPRTDNGCIMDPDGRCRTGS